jgi:hypothetical protein
MSPLVASETSGSGRHEGDGLNGWQRVAATAVTAIIFLAFAGASPPAPQYRTSGQFGAFREAGPPWDQFDAARALATGRTEGGYYCLIVGDLPLAEVEAACSRFTSEARAGDAQQPAHTYAVGS